MDSDESSPFIVKISAADAAGSSVPSDFEWTYFNSEVTGSTKSIRQDSAGNLFALCGTATSIVKLASDGSETWNTGSDHIELGQMNDLVVKDTSLYLAGHIFTTTIFGRMVKIDATDGSMEWTQDYGNYPGGVNQYSGLE